MQPSGLYPFYVERQVFCRHDSRFGMSDLQRYETGLLVWLDCNEAWAGQWYFRLVAGMRTARWVPRGGKTAYEHQTRMRVGGFLFGTGCRGQIKTEIEEVTRFNRETYVAECRYVFRHIILRLKIHSSLSTPGSHGKRRKDRRISMFQTVAIGIALILLAGIAVTMYCACVAAGEADRRMNLK